MSIKSIKSHLLLTFLAFLVLAGCNGLEESPIATSSSESALMQPGDVVITSGVADSAILVDSDGNFKKLLLNLPNNLENVYGVSWNKFTQEVIFSVNGSPDRILAVSAITGEVREAVRNTQYNGNTYGVTVDSSGGYIAIESNNLERFTATGSRINDGNFPTSVFTTATQINMLQNGNFVLCGTGTDRVRIYDDTASQVAEASSGIGGTTNAYGCAQLPNGNIVASWDGTTDSVRIYNSDLSSEIVTFADPSYFNSTRGLGVKSNGNILVADAGFDWVIELNGDGEFVRVFASGFLNDPWQVMEIPDF